MKNSILKPIFNAVRYWYVPLIVGILFVLASIFAFSAPAISFLTLTIFFSVSLLLSGLSEIIFSVSNTKTLDNGGWYLIMGIVTFIIGLMLVRNLGLSAGVLALYIGFTVLFRSIATISFSIDIKKYGVKNWGVMLTFGILGTLTAILLITNPVIEGLSAVILMAFAFLFIGLFAIYLSFQLRKLHKYSNKIKPELKERFERIQEEIREAFDS